MTGTDDSSGTGAPGIFEMLWDCAYCGTRGLLGQSHRHCPKCGAPQDPQRRYFPPLGQEVAARNTAYDGADRTCPACATPCGARAQHCPNCGSPLAAAREVVRRTDPLASTVATAATPPAARPAGGKRLFAFLLLALGGLALCVFLLSWKKEATVRVAGHAWKREIAIERLDAVSESTWCDQLPAGAYDVTRSREVRSHRQVPAGERCHTVNADRGDGTFERREVCEPVFRDEPVYDLSCRFRIDRWRPSRSIAAGGQSLVAQPSWPAAGLAAACTGRGCEREGARSERYVVTLIASDGRRFECTVKEAAWRRYPVGTVRPMRVGVVTGTPDCTSLF